MSAANFIYQKTLGAFVKSNGILSRPFFAGKGFIICLHRVLPASSADKSGMSVSPEYLEWLLQSIRQFGFEIIAVNEVPERLKQHNSKPFAVITLDDGWKDNLEYAYPVFKKQQAPFTIYVTNCFPNKTAFNWAETLMQLVFAHTQIQFSYQAQEFAYSLHSSEARMNTYNTIRYFILDSKSVVVMNEKIEQVFKHYEQPPPCTALSWKEIQELSSDSLCTIGAHTQNHVPLAKFTAEDALQEMVHSKQELEANIQLPVQHFAYPFGSKNECSVREFELAAQAGFSMSVTGRQGNIFSGNATALHAIPRYPIGEATGAERLKFIADGTLHFSFNGFKKIVTD